MLGVYASCPRRVCCKRALVHAFHTHILLDVMYIEKKGNSLALVFLARPLPPCWMDAPPLDRLAPLRCKLLVDAGERARAEKAFVRRQA